MSFQKNQMLDTIVAISASGGQNAISIVRLCGQDALSIANSLTKSDIKPREATLRSVYSADNEFLDDAIVLYFKSPYSFNGEDIIEIQCHGGKVMPKLILQNCIKLGARIADPGEFTKIAVLNNKIDFSKAEAIGAIVNAVNDKSAKILAKQLKGSLAEFVKSNRDEMLNLLAHCEVNIDYAEEDLPLDILEMIRTRLEDVLIALEKTLNASKRRRSLFTGLTIGIIGRPNVGKSSLLNALLAYDRAIVSDVAGTTRDTIEEVLNVGEYLVKLVDTAGIRHSVDKIENIGIKYSLKAFADSDIVLALFDGSRPFSDEDMAIVELMDSDLEKVKLVVVTKSDLKQELSTELLLKYEPLYISTKQNECEALEKRLKNVLDIRFGDDGDVDTLINNRQIDACQSSYDSLVHARNFLNNNQLEIFTFYIREAMEAIGLISSGYDNEEMLDKMFSGFCVGK